MHAPYGMHQKFVKNVKNELNRPHDASKTLPRRPQDAPRQILAPFLETTWSHLGHLFRSKTAPEASRTPQDAHWNAVRTHIFELLT